MKCLTFLLPAGGRAPKPRLSGMPRLGLSFSWTEPRELGHLKSFLLAWSTVGWRACLYSGVPVLLYFPRQKAELAELVACPFTWRLRKEPVLDQFFIVRSFSLKTKTQRLPVQPFCFCMIIIVHNASMTGPWCPLPGRLFPASLAQKGGNQVTAHFYRSWGLFPANNRRLPAWSMVYSQVFSSMLAFQTYRQACLFPSSSGLWLNFEKSLTDSFGQGWRFYAEFYCPLFYFTSGLPIFFSLFRAREKENNRWTHTIPPAIPFPHCPEPHT